MNNSNYRQVVDKAIQDIDASLAKSVTGDINYRLGLECKANLQRFFPGNDFDHAAFYRDTLINREWAIADEDNDYILKDAEIRGDKTFLQPGAGPAIYCTFHLGSYRLINFLLSRSGVDFSLVIDDDAVRLQADKFNRIYERMERSPEYPGTFSILNAEKQNIGINMIRTLKSNRSLLLYLDGNSGVGGMDRRDEKLLSIELLAGRILARKGISYISYRTKTPIVPVYSFREGDKNVLELLPAVYPDVAMSSDEYCQATTQLLYDNLALHLRTRPTQWEGWLYVQKFVDFDEAPLVAESAATEGLSFNLSRYDIYQNPDEKGVLFDRHDYSYFSISKGLYTVLNDTIEAGCLQYQIKRNLLDDLCRRAVLIAA
ncbi:hypothetical protein FUA23_14350 [Neolewinella aurantiaca]|uniref:Lauroyl/myristoyl acyltransferase n=1 Tax=Neolewinella aurantiaca TaxID=2602767 RepID=A0A5C7FFQ8_9BACT|nr:hypothetical protein [Neolewinella aurantiaca]TXF88463.1 hypothetical protein FUA23_14350 [Neolewinella aurantiaca]